MPSEQDSKKEMEDLKARRICLFYRKQVGKKTTLMMKRISVTRSTRELLTVHKIFFPPEHEVEIDGRMYALKDVDLNPPPKYTQLPLTD